MHPVALPAYLRTEFFIAFVDGCLLSGAGAVWGFVLFKEAKYFLHMSKQTNGGQGNPTFPWSPVRAWQNSS